MGVSHNFITGRRFRRSALSRLALLLLVCLCFFGCKAQTRSTNIQTINGKQFYIHKIEKKQSLYSISKLYNIPVETLYELNPGLSQGAKANQEIRIPVVSAASSTTTTASPIDTSIYNTHKVAKGETVYSLSRKFNLSEKQLLAYNPTLAAGMQEGQVIIVGEKKKKGKWQKKAEPDYTVKNETPVTLLDSSLFRPVPKPTKPAYNVALLLPFRLSETHSVDPAQLARTNSAFPSLPALSVDFYLGFKRAADSLGAAGFSISLKLFDVDENDSAKLNRIAAAPEFRELDMVFGPLHTSSLKQISGKCAQLNIPVISPIARENKILYNNVHVSKTNPSQFTLLESLADYCLDSLMQTKTNVILVSLSDKDKRETSYISAFRNYISTRAQQLARPAADSVRLVKGITGVKSAFNPAMKNVVVMLSLNQVNITDFTTQLAMLGDRKELVLCGWENVTEMGNIDQEYLNQLRYTFPTQFNLSNTAGSSPLVASYITQQQSLPEEYFYMGFDIGYYYLKNLKEQGPGFVHRLDQLPMETSYMRFRFARPDQATGFDNRGVFIFRYNNYQLEKTGW